MKVEKIYKTNINHWTAKSNTTFTEETKFDFTKAEEVKSAHGGGYEVWINMEEKPEDFSLIRKELPLNTSVEALGKFLKK